MKIEGQSEKASRFIGKNNDLRRTFGPNVIFHIVESDNRLRVMIDVGEDATYENLRQSIPTALQWRDKLLEWQGPWTGGGRNPSLERLHHMHKGGKTYAQIAERINSKVEERLFEYFAYIEELKEELPNLHTYGDFFLWNAKSKHNSSAFDHAEGMLQIIRLDDDEISIALNDGLDNISNGRKPFDNIDEYPVTKERVKRTIRSWREGVKHQIIEKKESKFLQDRGGENS